MLQISSMLLFNLLDDETSFLQILTLCKVSFEPPAFSSPNALNFLSWGWCQILTYAKTFVIFKPFNVLRPFNALISFFCLHSQKVENYESDLLVIGKTNSQNAFPVNFNTKIYDCWPIPRLSTYPVMVLQLCNV